MGLVKESDVLAETVKDDIKGKEPCLTAGWDNINVIE